MRYACQEKAQLKNVVDIEQLQADAFRGQRFSLLELVPHSAGSSAVAFPAGVAALRFYFFKYQH
ncbi:hypothetical protein [Pseudalkalibacillus sp. SCS-8]|uniref:hypothetical protein n=1 Tax=Pseudalkalibacillus nanhaiensis TaxID=3115291 RepID=UPI0032DA4FD2